MMLATKHCPVWRVILAALATSGLALVAPVCLAADANANQAAQNPTVTSKRRETHWSFRPPRKLALPTVKNWRWIRNPVDQFVLARLEREQVTPSSEADRTTLIRRLSLDLTGLPPTPEQVADFIADRDASAYEHLVDRLLASSHFGERWGRHWLDLARYADSDGYQVDRARPFAYVYRNWVIDAVNRDLPYDQFTIEQLAGDLLPNATLSQKIATGFHRNTLMNREDGIDPEEFRCLAKADRVNTTGEVWLGLTVGCAQCHSHKYDPIAQTEYYQLYAFFDQADEVDIPAPQADEVSRYQALKLSWEGERRRIEAEIQAEGQTKPSRVDDLKKALAGLQAAAPTYTESQAQTIRQREQPVQTFVHIRGDFHRLGQEVQPGGLAALPPLHPRGAAPDRLDLARWLVDPANPLTARVEVNRTWQHLFGRGLVATPEDFGARGEAPTHPELLDWLAVQFRDGGWSRKALIKLIVTSATYRQSSHWRNDLEQRDPQNLWLARQGRFRVESEIVRDLCLSAAGLLNDEIGGPSFRPPTTPDFKALGSAGAFTWVDSAGPERYRRGVYVYSQRTVPYPVAATFDAANPSEACPRREHSDTPLQALTLLNNPVFFECAQGLGQRMASAGGGDARKNIARGFALCFSRPPTKAELDRLARLFEDERRAVEQAPDLPARLMPESATPAAAAYVAVAQTMLNLDEFTTRE